MWSLLERSWNRYVICLDNHPLISWMDEGTFIRVHVLSMMVYFNVVEMNGAVIDKVNQVSFTSETLPKSFLQFNSNVVMNKLVYNLTILLNELQTYESLMKVKGQKRDNCCHFQEEFSQRLDL